MNTHTQTIRVGIAGGAGYTGGELIRILLNHPNTKIVFVHSKSNAGNPLSTVHADLLGDTQMTFTDSYSNDIDVLFLCMGHGESVKFVSSNNIPDSVKIIDLSQDFRLKSNQKVGTRNFVYGLPELNKEAIKNASNIANPGCFATTIQLALLPLAYKKALNNTVHVSAVTGSTGAGQSLSATNHFSWRNNNISIYKPFQHQHLGEITQSLKQLQSNFASDINFIPYRGNFSRGILAALYLTSDLSLEEAYNSYRKFYEPHPFIIVAEKTPDIKQVVNTNKCILHLEKHGTNILIQSVTDNLTKGASGQAVQNMNLIFGLDESVGLKLKASAF